MEIFVEKQPNCLATLRATVPVGTVNERVEQIATEYRKVAKVPGFRPGKAPLAAVARKYKDIIVEETVKRLVSDVVRQAAKDNNLTILNAFDLKHGEVGGGRDLDLSVQLTLEPEFTLPDLEKLDLEILEEVVTDEHVEGQITRLLERMAEFSDVEGRGLVMGDYAVLDYDAAVDGQPLGEACPEAPSTMKGGEGLWVVMAEDSLWPGFCAGLLGAAPGDERVVEVAVPETAGLESLRGKTIRHNVRVKGIKSRSVPPLTDEIAQKVAGRNADELRAEFRQHLERAAVEETGRRRRAAGIEKLVQEVAFEVPASMLVNEARRVVKEIVEMEQARGLSDEDLLSRKDDIFNHAHMGAQFRVKADFILTRIAREQGLSVSGEELSEHVDSLARRLNMPVEKLVKQLVKRDAVAAMEGDVLRDKALDFLSSKVNVKSPAAKE